MSERPQPVPWRQYAIIPLAGAILSVGIAVGQYRLSTRDTTLEEIGKELTLRAVSSLQNIATADCMSAAMELIAARSKPALIVLDLNLPDVSGLDGLVKLKAAVSPCPVIVVSSMNENAMIAAALAAGASAAGASPRFSV